jgi:hypothetical protein
MPRLSPHHGTTTVAERMMSASATVPIHLPEIAPHVGKNCTPLPKVVATLSLKNIIIGAPVKDPGFRFGNGAKPGAKSDKPIIHGSGVRAINYSLFDLDCGMFSCATSTRRVNNQIATATRVTLACMPERPLFNLMAIDSLPG